MRYYISLSIQCLFFTTILIELSTVKAKNQCINHHGDSGFCSHREICRLLKGVNIGYCNSSMNIVCCMELPCSKSQTKIKNIAKFRVKKSSNTGRLIVPSCGIRNERDRQVIGGQAVTDSMRHPWMVSLWQRNITTNQFADSFPICGAGIITDRHVITAAHCIMNSPDAQNDLFLLGGSTINEIPLSYRRTRKVIMRIKKITIHPSFDFLKLENDIAIITLETPIKFRLDLSPICLPDPGDEVIKDYVTVSGWGCLTEKCEASEAPSSLRETILPVIPNKIAMCWFMSDSKRKGREEYIPNTLFLVGGDISGLKSTCRGDSGSPVTRPRPSDGRIEVVGLVSWSKGCGRKFRPSVWTNVRNYLTWIYQNLN
ncbi:trypsin-1 [Lepeophtheirus salmonis]|nr:trypsin-1-like [Lepeophtheirus salmonis]